ncbi:MAG: hypothetical protein IJ274_09805 [Lachnospiraceae bacterium]|nr:hypothetical protein [Lachnospiraceae bacterium]
MDVKKYRLYLVMFVLVVILVSALSYLYFSEQDKSYREGTLVHNELVIEEEVV